jgi:ketosteroid isomerase-like protein
MRITIAVAALACSVSAAAAAQVPAAEAVAIVERYHIALSQGDSAGALALLTNDAIILENGSVETRAEYRSHHLPADIEFARAVPSTRRLVAVTVADDVAWVSTTSVSEGEFRGRPVNSAGAELMVLVKEGSAWKIAAIHWSSRTRRP